MSKPLSISIPHKLGKQEARRRLESGLTKARQQFGGQLANVTEAWSGDRLTFSLTAVGQSVTGRLDVTDDAVNLEINLPWLLAALVDKVRGRVETEGRKLLAGPPPAGKPAGRQ